MSEREGELVRELEGRLQSWAPALSAKVAATEAVSIEAYRDRVTTGTWEERWPRADGSMQTLPVRAQLWTQAMQAAVDQHAVVRIPARPEPYYLDAPLVLASGHALLADAKAEIRLRPGASTCLVRNAHPLSGQGGPLPAHATPDTDILVQGGIWTTLATSPAESNGNGKGRADAQDSIPGAHGVLFFDNVRRLVVTGVTIRQSRAFGVHLGATTEFLVQDIRLEDHHRDGVHVQGQSSYGVIRGVGGVTGDDLVALNAWDWLNCTMAFGPIHHVLVDDITCGRALPDGRVERTGSAEIRLLPGHKTFADGTKQVCDIHDVVIRRVRAIRAFKMYDQPNLELGRDRDYSEPIGDLRRIYLRQITTAPTGEALAQVHTNVDGLSLAEVTLQTAQLPPGYALVSVGPLSQTYQHNPQDSRTWVEIFSPDKDCTVRDLHLSQIRLQRSAGATPEALEPDRLVRVIQQRLNPDYPRTLPRGGTGRGILLKSDAG